MALLSRDSILAAPDRRFTEVHVPEWNGTVRLASLTAAQLLQYHEEMGKPSSDHVGWLLSASIVDEDGKAVFTAEDIPALQAKAPAAVLRVFNEASKLNAMDAESVRGN